MSAPLKVGVCEVCELVRPLKHIHDSYWCNCDERACADCILNEGEAAEQASLSDYYGGSSPQTLDEQCAAAWAQKHGGGSR